MIKFKCIYCGQRILAKDDGTGKKGKCPKCAHLLTVPESTKGRPAISFDKEPMPDQPKPCIPAWGKGSGFDADDAKEELTALFKESFGFLIPTYDKLSLLLMALTLILLYMTNDQFRQALPFILPHATNNLLTHPTQAQLRQLNMNQTLEIESKVFGSMFFFIIAYPIFLFLRKLMEEEEMNLKKEFILFFAILINASTGLIAGLYVKNNFTAFNWLIVFPILNIYNSTLLVWMLFTRFINEDCISDRKVTLFQFCLGFTAVVVIFLLCNYVFKLYWAITFSICTVYTTSFDRALQNVFPGLTGQKYEQSEV